MPSSRNARRITNSTFKSKLDKRTTRRARRIRRPASHRSQSQKLLRQANRKPAIGAAGQNAAAHGAGRSNQAFVPNDLLVVVKEKERVSILPVPRSDGTTESHVNQLIKSAEREDISPSRVAEANLGDVGISRSADFTGVYSPSSGGGVVVQSEAVGSWAWEDCSDCSADDGGADVGGDVRDL